MFLAIINDTYADVKLEVMSRKSEFQVGDFFKTGLNNVKGYLGIIDRLLYEAFLIKTTVFPHIVSAEIILF